MSLKSLKKRLNWLTQVQFDKNSGFYRYQRYGQYIYIRHPRHFLEAKENLWQCENLFFKHYLPKAGEVVVDLGSGYGEEALYLLEKSPQVKYFGVEAQPIIYECLANTFHKANVNFKAVPYVITDRSEIKFVSQFSYASVGEIPAGYIEVPTISWENFLKRYQIEQIDLFKMNIEGAEKEVLKLITDFKIIKRFIISCHDFRANHGEGEFYRSKKEVLDILSANNYSIKEFNYGINWADDWIYAERI
jgi:FkbM family methyltransferase